jgi:hypothetical protein
MIDDDYDDDDTKKRNAAFSESESFVTSRIQRYDIAI